MSKTEPRLPEIGEYVRGQGTLIAAREVVPPPPPVEKDYIFEEISARIELRLDAEVLKHIAELWDAYGKESSVEAATEEAKLYASVRGIGPESELEVVVIRVVGQNVKRPRMGQENAYDRAFCSFDWIRRNFDLPDPVENVVWSSREVKP